jgi:hypothetical protein
MASRLRLLIDHPGLEKPVTQQNPLQQPLLTTHVAWN